MKYDSLTIQKLRELPVFDVCGKLGITLYGMGQLTKRAKCWYHDDQHPSMHVNKQKNIFKCFVCGKGGDVIRLVRDYNNLSFVEACDWLAKEFCITAIPSDVRSKNTQPSSLRHPPSYFPLPPSPLSPLPSNLVTQSLSVNSGFCKSIVSSGYLTEQQLHHAAQRYRLGASHDGSVIFWEIDDQNRVHNGKLMHYLPDCHRDKSRSPTWMAAELKKSGTLPPDFENPHCLFGLHLTSDISHQTSTVCIVESEKTAVICSELYSSALWLSCGGLQMFKPQLLEPLVQHRIIIFPDTDEKGEAFRLWSEIVLQAQRLYKFRYPLRVSPLLELQASEDQKKRKIDIVDFLFEDSASKPTGLCVQTP